MDEVTQVPVVAAAVKPKNKGGRPKGSRTVKDGSLLKSSKRMADLMRACYSDEEWARRFKRLSPSEQFRLRGGSEARPKDEVTGSVFNLIIRGLSPAACPNCGYVAVEPVVSGVSAEVPESSASPPSATDIDAPRAYTPDPDALARLNRDAFETEGW